MTLSDGRVVINVSKESESLKEYLSVHERCAIINIWSVPMCSVHVSKSEVSCLLEPSERSRVPF